VHDQDDAVERIGRLVIVVVVVEVVREDACGDACD
jgi:hypothetical protein